MAAPSAADASPVEPQGPPPEPSLGLLPLPDDLLHHCLSFVGQKKRCEAARWPEAAVPAGGGRGSPRGWRPPLSAVPFPAPRAGSAVRGDGGCVLPADWQPRLTALRSLDVSGSDYFDDNRDVRLLAGISRLTALADAKLQGGPLVLAGPLPPSLTRLVLHNDPVGELLALPTQVRRFMEEPESAGPDDCLRAGQVMLPHCKLAPAQIAQLAALERLDLAGVEQAAPGMAALPHLPRLRHLQLYSRGATGVSRCLPALTALESLHAAAHGRCPGAAATMTAAVGRLQGLTRLVRAAGSRLGVACSAAQPSSADPSRRHPSLCAEPRHSGASGRRASLHRSAAPPAALCCRRPKAAGERRSAGGTAAARPLAAVAALAGAELGAACQQCGCAACHAMPGGLVQLRLALVRVRLQRALGGVLGLGSFRLPPAAPVLR